MIKKKLIIILLVLISTIVNSQSQNLIGVNGGMNYSSYRGNRIIDNYNGNFDFVIGIGYEYILNNKLSFEADLNYENKGWNDEVDLDPLSPLAGGVVKLTYKAKYINIPILLKYNLDNFFIKGGGFISFFLGESFSPQRIEQSDSRIKTLDLGLVLGVGLKVLENNYGILSIELRNNLGLMNTSTVPVIDNGTIKTNSLNLIASWDFKL